MTCDYNPVTQKYEGEGLIPIISENGIWRIYMISISDKAENSRTYNENDIKNLEYFP